MMEQLANLFGWLGWAGAVSALIAFMLFYWLIHQLPRRSGRFLNQIRQDPLPLIVGLCAAILVFYFFERQLLGESRFHMEVVSTIFQFLFLIILGGAVTTIYRARLQLREDAEHERANRVTITERDRMVLSVMRDNLVSAYNRVKRVRRLLRARLVYPKGADGPRYVPKPEYNEQMEQVIDAELEFESILRQIEGNVPLFGKDSRLDGCLDDIESHLTGTVKEFRRELRNFEGEPPQMNLEKLPKLERFLGLEQRDTAETNADECSKHLFKNQFRSAIRYLQREINKLTRRINRTGSILWVDDKPQNNKYEIGRLEDAGYEVTKAPSTDEAKAQLNNGPKPMLVISNMGRLENGNYNSEAGLDLLKEVGTDHPVFFYTSYAAVSKYGKEVQPLGGKGITDSRLLLLKIIDECAEEVERIDQAEPTMEKPTL